MEGPLMGRRGVQGGWAQLGGVENKKKRIEKSGENRIGRDRRHRKKREERKGRNRQKIKQNKIRGKLDKGEI